MPEARFHDLRHSYAVAAIHAGNDIKTVHLIIPPFATYIKQSG